VERLVQGHHQFRATVFRSERELYERLRAGQNPDTLFITCSDSRVSPTQLTMSRPGDLFVVRNAGNIVPPFVKDGVPGGEIATIEFAVEALGVKDIVICGHSHCGAVQAVLDPSKVRSLPSMAGWLKHADEVRRIIAERYTHLSGDALVDVAVAENVLVQLEHLETHPAVAGALLEGKVRLHAWVYFFETGEVHAFDREKLDFVPLSEIYPPRPPTNATRRVNPVEI